MSLYLDVEIDGNATTDIGLVYALKLSVSQRRINWEFSKRLIFGSLVCLSNDYFQRHILVGVICERNLNKLREQGIIYVKFDEQPGVDRLVGVQFRLKYTMVETSAYFESYKHVLKALVAFGRDPAGENAFPFREHIVYARNNHQQAKPAYLSSNLAKSPKIIDFRPLLTNTKRPSVLDTATGLMTYEFDASSTYAATCNADDERAWPNRSQLGLDESQYTALKLALNNKLALIQG